MEKRIVYGRQHGGKRWNKQEAKGARCGVADQPKRDRNQFRQLFLTLPVQERRNCQDPSIWQLIPYSVDDVWVTSESRVREDDQSDSRRREPQLNHDDLRGTIFCQNA